MSLLEGWVFWIGVTAGGIGEGYKLEIEINLYNIEDNQPGSLKTACQFCRECVTATVNCSGQYSC